MPGHMTVHVGRSIQSLHVPTGRYYYHVQQIQSPLIQFQFQVVSEG